MGKRGKRIASIALATAALHILPAGAVDRAPESASFTYKIERKGAEIGRHSVAYSLDRNGEVGISIEARIRVRFAFITVFKMDHAAHEIWEDNRLVQLVSRTHKNDERDAVEVRATNGHFVIQTADSVKTAPPDLVPSSFTKRDFWIDEGEKDFMLLDTLSGLMRPSRLIYGGSEALELDGQAFDTRYYKVINLEKNVLSHEFWIDGAGYLIQGHLLTKEGESLYYRFAGSKNAESA